MNMVRLGVALHQVHTERFADFHPRCSKLCKQAFCDDLAAVLRHKDDVCSELEDRMPRRREATRTHHCPSLYALL